MSVTRQIADLVSTFAGGKPVRAGSLIISVFGDSISQHGNSVWLGSLIRALQPFGINQRQIRTAVFRLVREDWLHSRQVGRRSYYSFTDSGRRHYEKAARRIYSNGNRDWNGKWTLLVPFTVGNDKREQLRKELNWLGFGSLSNTLYVHPSADRSSVEETLQELGIGGSVMLFEANTGAQAQLTDLAGFTGQCWDLPQIADHYSEFIRRFQPLLPVMEKPELPQPFLCFQLRTLLIHEYRRILLHDTDLPDELLPSGWPGTAARTLAARLYRRLNTGTVEFLVTGMETENGNLPGPEHGYYERFGGIDPAGQSRGD